MNRCSFYCSTGSVVVLSIVTSETPRIASVPHQLSLWLRWPNQVKSREVSRN